MGREIEETAIKRGHEIVAKLDLPGDWQANEKIISQSDMVIEFSTPDAVIDNIRRCFDLHLPVVVGTTGWNKKEEKVKKWCAEEKQTIFVASNFSIGINILYSLARQLSDIVNKIDGYDISIEEIHHIHKLDSPSGTAIRLAEIILNGIDRKNFWVNRSQTNPEELQVISVREGEIPGIHTINCDSDSDKLTLQHEAKGRKGFAIGALLAAEWLKGKNGFFEMKDLLQLPG